MSSYKYEVAQCSVRDHTQLEKYRRKRTEWLRLLETDENSVFNQIHSMMWHCAVFHAINESRRVALASGGKSAALNGMLAEFIDNAFATTQALAIRRILESPKKKEAIQVVSLRRVLDDLRANRALITREMYVCHDGLPYHTAPAQADEEELMKRVAVLPGVFVGSTRVTGPGDFDTSEMAHEAFDKLAGVDETARKPSDLISDNVFKRLDERLAASGHEKFKLFADKIIAHASDAHSRTLADVARASFTLERLAECQKAICQVANFVGGYLIWGTNHGGFPIPQFDQFENLDSSWCTEAGLNELHARWEKYVADVDGWATLEVEDLI